MGKLSDAGILCWVIVWLDSHTSIHVDASGTDGIQTFTLVALGKL